MSVRLRLVVIIVFVALLPLSVSAYTTIGLHSQAQDRQLAELHLKTAEHGATVASSRLQGASSALATLATNIDWPNLSAEEREGALWLMYGQLDAVAAVSLLDGEGKGLGTAYVEASSPRAASHPAISVEALRRFARSIPPAKTGGAPQASGNPFALDDGTLVVPFAFTLPGPTDAERWVLAVAYSLGEVCSELDGQRHDDTALFLTDDNAMPLCLGSTGGADVARNPATKPGQLPQGPGRAYRVDAGGEAILAAHSPTFEHWQVIVEQPERLALASNRRIRMQSGLWIAIAVVAAVLAGLVLARGINQPIFRLTEGAGELAKGNFGYRLATEGKDEIGQLSAAFNRMGAEIEQRDVEIRQWNEELQQRVDARTAELKAAQQALLESRKIAAMASLGAGIAHEINNPLTGVIGLAQVLKAKALKRSDGEKEAKLLASVEGEALRIRDIVGRMLVLAQSQEGEGFVAVSIQDLVRRALAHQHDALDRASIELSESLGGAPCMVSAHSDKLEHALSLILDNAVKSIDGERRTITVSVGVVDDELVRITVQDSGIGIAPENIGRVFEPFFTTKVWPGQGLGLSTAYRTIEAHRGQLRVASQIGDGTTVTITLPIARKGAHLV